ncbi:hypothetical protein MNB_SV-4-1105 [hydrothermal vent metagenome]|uniref:Bll5565 protein n=1 Tax=hydrothermal vent metagenome TaxID=652676 RepID=A0A1W1E8S6_9ZZZZ
MIGHMKNRLISLLQLFLVLIFIIFEEIVWEGISLPIYNWVHSLKALEKIELWLQGVPAGVILVLFVLMLTSVEVLGIYAGVMFVSGHIVTGMMMYAGKIPVAAFTFWMFRVSEEKLTRFGWFRWLYGKIMGIISWLKSLEIYQCTMQRLKKTKEKLKAFLKYLRAIYFQKESPFWHRFKRLYRSIKRILKRG